MEAGISVRKKFLGLDDVEGHRSLHRHLIHALGKQRDQLHIALHGHAVQGADIVHTDYKNNTR